MQPALFITRSGAARRGAELLALREAAFFRILPKRAVNADKSVERGFRVALFNRAGFLTGFAMEAA